MVAVKIGSSTSENKEYLQYLSVQCICCKDLNFEGKSLSDDICFPDSATTYIIFQDKKYLWNLTLIEATVNSVVNPIDLLKALEELY